jgi:hypothetical protein
VRLPLVRRFFYHYGLCLIRAAALAPSIGAKPSTLQMLALAQLLTSGGRFMPNVGEQFRRRLRAFLNKVALEQMPGSAHLVAYRPLPLSEFAVA